MALPGRFIWLDRSSQRYDTPQRNESAYRLNHDVPELHLNVLLSQVAVVVRHTQARAHTRALATVTIDDRAAIGVIVVRTGVARAGTYLSELAAAVVEEFVIDWRSGTELLFQQTANGRVHNTGRIRAAQTITEIAAGGTQPSGLINDIGNRVAGGISQRADQAR